MLSIRFYAGLRAVVYDFVSFGNVRFVKDAVTSAARFWSELRRWIASNSASLTRTQTIFRRGVAAFRPEFGRLPPRVIGHHLLSHSIVSIPAHGRTLAMRR